MYGVRLVGQGLREHSRSRGVVTGVPTTASHQHWKEGLWVLCEAEGGKGTGRRSPSRSSNQAREAEGCEDLISM